MTSMTDIGFSQDGGSQDGTGDLEYLGFIHKFTGLLGVCSLPPSIALPI